MSCFVKHAKVSYDVESDMKIIEIKYTKYIKELGHYCDYTDFFNTVPMGDWNEIRSQTGSVQYENFLYAMVRPTLEVRRKMASIALHNILCENRAPKVHIELMNRIHILDPSFDTPFINRKCSWQNRLVRMMSESLMPQIIDECKNAKRLEKFFISIKELELKLR